MNAFWRVAATLTMLAILGGCTSKGDDDVDRNLNPGGGGGNGDFQPRETFANRCANPRSGIDPFTGSPYPDQAGSAGDENNFLRSWTNETYLWYNEVTYPDPASSGNPREYFDVLKTNATTEGFGLVAS
jgi:carboxyl-terminal processing protease